MASTNKTPKLGLNQWEPGDEVMRADFNEDNRKLDALKGASSCVVGHFIGDDKANRAIHLGFRPSFVLLLGCASSYYGAGYILDGTSFSIGSNGQTWEDASDTMCLTDTGLLIKKSDRFNIMRQKTVYVAYH